MENFLIWTQIACVWLDLRRRWMSSNLCMAMEYVLNVNIFGGRVIFSTHFSNRAVCRAWSDFRREINEWRRWQRQRHIKVNFDVYARAHAHHKFTTISGHYRRWVLLHYRFRFRLQRTTQLSVPYSNLNKMHILINMVVEFAERPQARPLFVHFYFVYHSFIYSWVFK